MPSAKIGVTIAPMLIQDAASQARFLEKCGYESLWMSDETLVFNPPPELIVPDIFPMLTLVAASTKEANVGTAVLDASIRYPVKTAQSIATVDNFSGGRMRIGIGGGEGGNREPFGIPMDHLFGRMDEAVRVMKLLFSSSHEDRVSFSGRFYSLKDAYLKIRPAQKGGPPLLISAFGPRALRLAGEVGDGWLSFSHTPESYAKVLRGPVSAAAKSAGRSLRGFETALVLPICMSADVARARKTVATIAKDWIVWSPDNMKLVAPDVEQPRVRQPYAKRNEAKAIKALAELSKQIPDDPVLGTTAYGSADQCVEQLSRFVDAGVRQLILYVVNLDEPFTEAARAVSKKVLPHFSRRS